VLLVVLDNGSNMIKAVSMTNEFQEQTDNEEKEIAQNDNETDNEKVIG
jgi:hypothetical protein